MIGVAKSALSSSFTPAEYGVFISPTNLFINSSNGSSTSPLVSANVTGGVGPFTYEWTIDNSAISVASPEEKDTRFSTSGYNSEEEGKITITVKDTGNSDMEVTDETIITFRFGALQ